MDRSRQNALLVLATTPDYTKAAKQLGVAVSTIYDWVSEPAFVSELSTLRNRMVEEGIAKLKGHVTKAVDTLGVLLDDTSSQIRRGAANDILTHTVRFKEHMDLENRLAELEQKIINREVA